jgi:hypothetical protein
MRRPVDSAGRTEIFFATILLQVAVALFHALILRDGVSWATVGI